jgi:hypothetical protein
VKMTLGLLATSIFGSALYIIGIHTGGWDGLGTTFIAMVIYILGLIINVLDYLIRAIKERI